MIRRSKVNNKAHGRKRITFHLHHDQKKTTKDTSSIMGRTDDRGGGGGPNRLIRI
jgi:hypothetical protein